MTDMTDMTDNEMAPESEPANVLHADDAIRAVFPRGDDIRKHRDFVGPEEGWSGGFVWRVGPSVIVRKPGARVYSIIEALNDYEHGRTTIWLAPFESDDLLVSDVSKHLKDVKLEGLGVEEAICIASMMDALGAFADYIGR